MESYTKLLEQNPIIFNQIMEFKIELDNVINSGSKKVFNDSDIIFQDDDDNKDEVVCFEDDNNDKLVTENDNNLLYDDTEYTPIVEEIEDEEGKDEEAKDINIINTNEDEDINKIIDSYLQPISIPITYFDNTNHKCRITENAFKNSAKKCNNPNKGKAKKKRKGKNKNKNKRE
jgi:hypothetical protein